MRLLPLIAALTRLMATPAGAYGGGAEPGKGIGRPSRATDGIPTEQGDKIQWLVLNRTASPPTIQLTATVYNPRTDASIPIRQVFTPTTSVFSSEVPAAMELPPGCVLVHAGFTATSQPNPVGVWVFAVLQKEGVNSQFLCAGYLFDQNLPAWPEITQAPSKVNASDRGAVFAYSATILNDGANAGNHVYTFTPASGSRLRLIGGQLLNGDAAGRVATADILIGTDIILSLFTTTTARSGTVAAGTTQGIPGNALLAAINGQVGQATGFIIPDGATFVVTLAAVAVSQDSKLDIMFEVWGGAPTVTETAPAGATITIEQELVLTG